MGAKDGFAANYNNSSEFNVKALKNNRFNVNLFQITCSIEIFSLL
jgi:hypothetical protein